MEPMESKKKNEFFQKARKSSFRYSKSIIPKIIRIFGHLSIGLHFIFYRIVHFELGTRFLHIGCPGLFCY